MFSLYLQRLKWDPDYVPSIFTFKKGDEKTNKAKLARSHRLQNRRIGCYVWSVCRSSQKCKSTNHDKVSEVENSPQEIDEVLEVENPPQELNVNDETDNNGVMDNRVSSNATETMEVENEQDHDDPSVSSVLHQP